MEKSVPRSQAEMILFYVVPERHYSTNELG